MWLPANDNVRPARVLASISPLAFTSCHVGQAAGATAINAKKKTACEHSHGNSQESKRRECRVRECCDRAQTGSEDQGGVQSD